MNKPLEFDMWLHEVRDRTSGCRGCLLYKKGLSRECGLLQIKALYRQYKKDAAENA